MSLELHVVITGRVAADIERVLIDGLEVPIIDGRYEKDVPVTQGVVAITAIDRDGREWTRTLLMSAAAGAVG